MQMETWSNSHVVPLRLFNTPRVSGWLKDNNIIFMVANCTEGFMVKVGLGKKRSSFLFPTRCRNAKNGDVRVPSPWKEKK